VEQVTTSAHLLVAQLHFKAQAAAAVARQAARQAQPGQVQVAQVLTMVRQHQPTRVQAAAVLVVAQQTQAATAAAAFVT
jgi:IS4 transposase